MGKGLILLLVFLIQGCMIAAMSNQIAMGHQFTPEQVEAYRKVGMKIYGCVKIGGPPPAGNAIFILVPEDGSYNPVWGDDCHVVK